MCFSPEADLIGGVVITGAGIDALRHVRHRREIGLAALPVVFGAHQIVEAFAWWGLGGEIPARVGDAARDVYLAIAFLLPLVVPVVIRSIEIDASRRRMMLPFVVVGGAVSAVLLSELAAGPVTAEACGRYISYDVHLAFGGEITALYVAVTCIPMLLSSERRLRWFGAANLAAVGVLAWLLAAGFISLWCAWAAVLSLVIVVHLRTAGDRVEEQTPQRV